MSLTPQSESSRTASGPQGVSLSELFPECAGDHLQVCRVASCTSDVRQVVPGDAFVCIDDGQTDGHELAREAAERGAAAIVCERAVPVFSIPTFVVEDSRIALGELCHALAGNPSEDLHVIGVLGTHGKTSTIALLESIFQAADLEVGVISSQKTVDGMSRAAGISECPSPAYLASRLANMEAAGCTHALVEVSCQALAQHRHAGFQYEALAVTHVSAADLEVHHTPANYRATARRALDLLSPEGLAVLNADDPTCCRWTAERAGPQLMYGVDGKGAVTARVIEQNACEQIILLTIGDESAAIRSSMLGEYHVQNCLAAAATALAQGISLEEIARGIEAVTRLPGRMERVDAGQSFPVFVDAARSPEALRCVLRTARHLASGKVICVLADEPSGDPNENMAIEMVVRKLADVAIVTDLVSTAAPWEAREDSELETQVAKNRQEAIEWAVAVAQSSDIVVIAGTVDTPAPVFGIGTAGETKQIRDTLLRRDQPLVRLAA